MHVQLGQIMDKIQNDQHPHHCPRQPRPFLKSRGAIRVFDETQRLRMRLALNNA